MITRQMNGTLGQGNLVLGRSVTAEMKDKNGQDSIDLWAEGTGLCERRFNEIRARGLRSRKKKTGNILNVL